VTQVHTRGGEDPDDGLLPLLSSVQGSDFHPRLWVGQAEAAVAKAPSASPPPTSDGVDKLYHQLVEIYAIAAA
jgi:hypothetical protein